MWAMAIDDAAAVATHGTHIAQVGAARRHPSAPPASLMAPKPRASGKHAPGSRTRAAGYNGKSGWWEYNRKLVAASEGTVMVTVHDVATKRLQASTALFCTGK